MHEGPGALADPKRGRAHFLRRAVGSHLMQLPGNLYYWREKQAEVDYIYQYRGILYAIEVKSGRRKTSKGLHDF